MRERFMVQIPGALLTVAGLMLCYIFGGLWRGDGAVLLYENNIYILAFETASVVFLTLYGIITWLRVIRKMAKDRAIWRRAYELGRRDEREVIREEGLD